MQKKLLIPFQGWRLVFFRGFALAIFSVLVLRTWELQFIRGAQFRADADENRFQTLPITAPRGVIYDRNGKPLALNDPAFLVTITPAYLPDSREETLLVYNRLSSLVDVPPTRAVADAAGRTNERSIDELVRVGEGIAPFRPVVIAVDVDKDIALQIRESELELPGVGVDVRSVRSYPSGLATAQIIGYLGPIPEEQAQELRELGLDPAFDRIGYAGIEAFFQDELAGRNGFETTEVDVAGQVQRLVSRELPEPGISIQLTIDLDLQLAAQQALIDRINAVNVAEKSLKTQSGVVIAVNPQTGEILASVSWPTYDNSRFARSIDGDYYFGLADDPLRPLVNQAISALYPPGSVWKLITAVAVVDDNVIDPYATLYDGGRLVLPNAFAPNDIGLSQTFVCWNRDGHQEQNLVDAIVNSCDVYFYQVGGGNPDVSEAKLKKGGLGPDRLYAWATAFGIGSRLGIEIPGEISGRMPDRQWKRRVYGESWSTGDTYNAAFGQGYVTVTPLQLLMSSAAIVNGGDLMQPTLIRNFQNASGEIIQEFEPQILRTLVPPANDEPMTLLLQEDMLLKQGSSLACRCEPNSRFYNPNQCNPSTYRNFFDYDANADSNIVDMRRKEYIVHVPYGYRWTAGVCDELEFLTGNTFVPPIASPEAIALTRLGMVDVVRRGTASEPANPTFPPLGYVIEGGKTGTAEYCDNIAYPQGLCIPGRWPSHAWYVGYASEENPEIMVIAFVYNGGEGSQVALPIVRQVLNYYYTRSSIAAD